MKTARLFRLAAAMPWAMEASWLRTILTIAAGQGPGPAAVSAELGRPLDNAHAVTLRDGVAIVPIVGPIVRRANALGEVSGATSVEMLARDLQSALTDPEVVAIVLEFDSPGGEVSGVHELAQMIFAARGEKPIVAYAGGSCASAAYWLAAATDRIVVDATAIVGSIGIVMAVPDPELTSAKEIEIVSSQSPKKRLDITTTDGRAAVQSTVDALAEVFLADVARYRGLDPDEVIEAGGAGGVLVGSAAVDVHLADDVGSLEALIAELSSSSPRAMPLMRAPADRRAGPDTMTMNRGHAATALATRAPLTAEADGLASSEDRPAGHESAASAEPQRCGGCASLNAAGARFCGQCGAALPVAKASAASKKDPDSDAGREEDEDPDEDDDEETEDDDKRREGTAAIVALTGRRSLAGALGVIAAWSHAAAELPKLRAALAEKTAAQSAARIDALVAKAKARGALTPALEKELRALGAVHLQAAASFAEALPPIAALGPKTHEPPTSAGAGRETALEPSSYRGERFEQMSFAARAELYRDQRDLYEQLKADALARGVMAR